MEFLFPFHVFSAIRIIVPETSFPTCPNNARIDEDPRLAEFVVSFREFKHVLLNTVAIWVAQAEIAKRDPSFNQRLSESILDRSQRLVELTRESELKLRLVASSLDPQP
ncbi:MAG: hypothetical protein JOY96_00710 [Verrucomicrobia bacterium]|nr:hypothetical protein [Verrucomicrobiota bacterium]